jgi:S1-C subfamily serine protease
MCFPSPHRSLLLVCPALLLMVVSLSLPNLCLAQSLKIDSNPPGATVELDGVPAGTTPLDKKFPGGYFHRTKTAIGQRLEHPMIARVSLPGYVTHEIALTEGPMDWIDLHGRHHGQYWLFKSSNFHVDLQTVAGTFTGSVSAAAAAGPQPATLRPELSLEEIVSRAKPAVVCLKSLTLSGSGFFVTDTGLIATNAHVARGESELLALLPNGVKLSALVVYIDADLDLALVKVTAPTPDFQFPHLPLADASLIHQGETVLAVGNPGDAMLFSVTKGIVSAVGRFPGAGPGTWIQTDAAINPGSSGGPLLNVQGEVIGLNTRKLVRKNVEGIGFALSSSDLLNLLTRFYPDLMPSVNANQHRTTPQRNVKLAYPADPAAPSPPAAAPNSVLPPSTPSPDDFGTLTITSNKLTAKIYVDGQYCGNPPLKLRLASGSHRVSVRSTGSPDDMEVITISPATQATINAIFDPPPQP